MPNNPGLNNPGFNNPELNNPGINNPPVTNPPFNPGPSSSPAVASSPPPSSGLGTAFFVVIAVFLGLVFVVMIALTILAIKFWIGVAETASATTVYRPRRRRGDPRD
jgi:hypothetical protein